MLCIGGAKFQDGGLTVAHTHTSAWLKFKFKDKDI